MEESKKTLVMGASENPERYSFKAINRLLSHGHEVKAIGKKEGTIKNVKIEKGKPAFEDIDTITLYLSPANQQQYYDYFISLKPKRIIFNPGAENPALQQLCLENKIEPVEACTLVMLAIGAY